MLDGYLKKVRDRVGHLPLILVFAGGVLFRNYKILRQHHRDRPGWSVFGGALEFGETTADTVKREYFEELGINVQIKGWLGLYDQQIDHYPNGDVAQAINIVYLVDMVDDQQEFRIDPKETAEVAWFAESEIPQDQMINDQHRAIIKDAFSAVK